MYFFGGSLACWVVDRVDVSYGRQEIVITIFGGYRNLGANKVCAGEALSQRVDVELKESLNGRAVVDGARVARAKGNGASPLLGGVAWLQENLDHDEMEARG